MVATVCLRVGWVVVGLVDYLQRLLQVDEKEDCTLVDGVDEKSARGIMKQAATSATGIMMN
jgi:hypothetical protein